MFAVGYCVVAEVFPKIKLWQGLLAGALAQLFVHMISFPLMGLTPPLFDLPWYENVSENFWTFSPDESPNDFYQNH